MNEMTIEEAKESHWRKLNANVKKMYVVHFCVNLHFVGAVLIPFFTNWGGITFLQVMYLQSWFLACLFIMEIPTGTIADKFGRKQSIALGTALCAIAAMLYGSNPPAFPKFIVGELLWATSSALFSGADNALVYDTLKELSREEESQEVFKKTATSARLSLLVSSPLGTVIAIVAGLHYTMFLMVVPMTIGFFMTLTIKEPRKYIKSTKRNYIEILKAGLKQFHKSKELKRLVIDAASIAVIAFLLIWLHQVKLEDMGVDISMYGLVRVVFIGGQIGAIFLLGKLESALKSRKAVLSLTTCLLGVSLILMGTTDSVIIVIIAITVGGGFGLSRWVLFDPCFNKYIESGERATVISTISMIRGIMQAIINVVIGVAVEASLDVTLVVLGVVTLAFTVLPRIHGNSLVPERRGENLQP
ncbi:MAG: MFS transporter [Candidatus Hodarchaeota archaeon]